MSAGKYPAACETPTEAERLEALESQVRDLAHKTRTEERVSMESKRRIEDLSREAEKQKDGALGTPANRMGLSTQDGENPI